MLSFPSHKWSSGHDVYEHRPSQPRTPRQPSSKYSSVMECSTYPRSSSAALNANTTINKTIASSSHSSQWFLPRLSRQQHHLARRRCHTRSSYLASSRYFHTRPSRQKASRLQQSKQNSFSAFSNIVSSSEYQLVTIMPRRKTGAGISKQAPKPAKRRPRQGRITAQAIDESLQELDASSPVGEEPMTENRDTTLTISDTLSPSAMTPPVCNQDTNTMKPLEVSIESIATHDQPKPPNDMSVSTVPSLENPGTPRSAKAEPVAHQPHLPQTSPIDAKSASYKGLPTPMASASPRLSTPENEIAPQNQSSSGLSSAPTSIGSTPEGFTSRQTRQSNQNLRTSLSPRRSARERKESVRATEATEIQPAKRRKCDKHPDVEVLSTIEESPIQVTVTATRSHKRKAPEQEADADDTLLAEPPAKKFRGDNQQISDEDPDELPSQTPKINDNARPARKQTKAEKARERQFYTTLTNDLAPAKRKEKRIWTNFNRTKVIMYGSDAQTQYTPAFAADTARRGGKTNGKGAARGGRGGGNNGRGRGGKSRGKGRDDDSPEPPQPKRLHSQDELSLMKHIKARQGELRRFFGTIAPQQAEILDMHLQKDLNRLAKKAKAHRQVPEYEEILEHLGEMEDNAKNQALKQYAIACEAATREYEAERAAVANRCNVKISDLQEEYKKGAQGDLIIFRRAVAAAHDETRTQDGSEADYFPHYHDFPDPDQPLRGYTATHITDEKPFKHHLLTYDDQARKEVIDDEYGPVIQAFAQKNAERRAEEERKKTQTIDALVEVAEEELEEIRGYLIPRPMWREEEANSFALSYLADTAEFMARLHPNKQYIYMPLEDGDTFPKEALNFDRLPGQGVHVPRPPLASPQKDIAPPPQRHVAAKPQLPPTTQPTRRSLRNLQPNAPLSQPQAQPSTPVNLAPELPPPASSASTGSRPTLAPAPPKLAPVLSGPNQQQRPPPIDTRPRVPNSPERSPVQPPSSQSHNGTPHGLPPLQPRHMSQPTLPPPPPLYGYPQQYSPTRPPQQYPPPPRQQHRSVPPPPYQHIPPPSPYRHQQHTPQPSPYAQHPPPSPYYQYGSPYYPQPPPQQQQYSFMPPQQGPAPPPHSSSVSHPLSAATPLPPHSAPPPSHDPYQNGYHHARNHSNPFSAPPPPQGPPPHQPVQPTTSVPPHTTSHSKSRARAKAKQPVTFVNQTLATRKAAAEQLAKEEAAAAAERKAEKEKSRSTGTGTGEKGTGSGSDNTNGSKLAPKN